jgi:YrbI family 3-deoxy-D-manno-octulosonate 8-phosphate phosphatase
MLPKLVFTDIDGVWTDGGMYYDQTGNEFKKFNTSDGAGVLLLHLLNIPVCIITGENTRIVENRAKKLGVDFVLQGVKNKLKAAGELAERLNIKLDCTAFIGDDINDIPLLKSVGLSSVPFSSPEYVKKHAHVIVPCRGGEGAFRVFVEYILSQNNLLDNCIGRLIDENCK